MVRIGSHLVKIRFYHVCSIFYTLMQKVWNIFSAISIPGSCSMKWRNLSFCLCPNCRQLRIGTEIKEHILFWNLLILTSPFIVVLKQWCPDPRYRTVWSFVLSWIEIHGVFFCKQWVICLKLLALSWLFNVIITLTKLLSQVNPYYDFEDCIDSDEELDLASMATWR